MTKTYSEQRQAILFKAARDMRAVAAQVLDGVQNPVELTSETTLRWAMNLAKRIATQANELEGRGHEECIASNRSESQLSRSRDLYSASIDAFEARVKAIAGGTYLLGVVKQNR